jgi:hypothetical protein
MQVMNDLKYLARKISRSKWEVKSLNYPDEIRADAITACLRTTQDSLSFWQCQGDKEDVAEVALALSAPMQTIETIHIVLLDKNKLVSNNLCLEATEGITPVTDLRNRHMDLKSLDMVRLCHVGREIATKVRQDSDCYRFTKAEIRNFICSAVKNKRLNIQELNEKVKEEVLKHL